LEAIRYMHERMEAMENQSRADRFTEADLESVDRSSFD